MRGSNSVNLLLALSSLEGCLAGRQAVFVTVELTRLTPINDTDLLVGAFNIDLLLLVVFDVAVPLGNIGCRDLGQGILNFPRLS